MTATFIFIECLSCGLTGEAPTFDQGDPDAGYRCPNCMADESGLDVREIEEPKLDG